MYIPSPSRRPEVKELYRQRFSPIYLIELSKRSFLLGLLLLVLLVGYPLVASHASWWKHSLLIGRPIQGLPTPSPVAPTLPSVPVTHVDWTVVWGILCLILAVLVIWSELRAIYKWKHTWLVLTTSRVTIIRSNNAFLGLWNQPTDWISVTSIGGLTVAPTMLETLFGLRWRTATIELKNLERPDNPFSHLRILDADELNQKLGELPTMRPSQ